MLLVRILVCPECVQMIAARRRPDHVPAYEVLYKTAEEVEHKRVEKKKIQEQAELEARWTSQGLGGNFIVT